jgi:hypothetical protein
MEAISGATHLFRQATAAQHDLKRVQGSPPGADPAVGVLDRRCDPLDRAVAQALGRRRDDTKLISPPFRFRIPPRHNLFSSAKNTPITTSLFAARVGPGRTFITKTG